MTSFLFAFVIVIVAVIGYAVRPSEPGIGDAIEAGRMPDLVGRDLQDLGERGTGVLFDLHDQIGVQETVHRADTQQAGVILGQEPAPGTPLSRVERWTLIISAGGPVVGFMELPPEVRRLARSLDNYDTTEPVLRIETDSGVVYKTDDWLLSDNCDAVEAAYRSTPDSDYRWACPGRSGRP